MTASNDQGNPILNKMAGRCQLTRLVDDKTVETHGYCTYTDADNNQIFEKCDFLPGQPNNCKLTGHRQIRRTASVHRHHHTAD